MGDVSKRMPWEELQLTQEYQRLTQKQKLFVFAYCSRSGSADDNYDAVAATRTAYQCKSPEVARIMSYSLMQNIRIIAVLNRYFQTEPIEAFLVMLDRAINNKKLTVAQIQALRLKCEIMGFGTRLPAQAPMAAGLKEAQATEKAIRKSKRKPPTSKPEPPSQYDDH